jgi:aromatic-L-amino-acid decarboxylase
MMRVEGGGMDDFQAAFARAGEWIEAYYRDGRAYPVFSRSQPGDLVRALPDRAPEEAESFDAIFADFERLIVPGITHWNHPRFFAYFAISATPAAVIAEALAATLDVNAMLWRTSPAATELEDVTVAWLRELLGLDAGLHGIVYDTASIGGFTALAAARESLGLGIRERGMAGRADLPVLRVYLTEHTHSHIEKAAVALGIGRDNVVRVPVDGAYAMRPDALAERIEADLAARDRRGDQAVRCLASRRRRLRGPGGDAARVPVSRRRHGRRGFARRQSA